MEKLANGRAHWTEIWSLRKTLRKCAEVTIARHSQSIHFSSIFAT